MHEDGTMWEGTRYYPYISKPSPITCIGSARMRLHTDSCIAEFLFASVLTYTKGHVGCLYNAIFAFAALCQINYPCSRHCGCFFSRYQSLNFSRKTDANNILRENGSAGLGKEYVGDSEAVLTQEIKPKINRFSHVTHK